MAQPHHPHAPPHPNQLQPRNPEGPDAADATDPEEEQAINEHRGHPVGLPPKGSHGKPLTWLRPTRFATAYRSIFTLEQKCAAIVPSLAMVNCSYLSTAGVAPTLLELKQHAQALTVLIKNLTMSTQAGLIDNANSGVADALPFNDGETFDFLNNLREKYRGPKKAAFMEAHHRPLTSLLNNLQQDIQPGYPRVLPDGSYEYVPPQAMLESHCPLHAAPETVALAPALPYATHQSLIDHANECLEMIDHEYSAKGGLLAILPKKEDKENRTKSEATLLGQLILYVQRLVQRLHDLERQYANSMDALAGEAVVPHQALSALGPDGRKGREMVFPQDRFVLVNAGEDVWQFLNSEFEYKEQIDERVAQNYKKHGVAGEAIWQQRGGKEMSRGITAIDITTRYYRLRNDPLKTIFVIPAHAEHPGTKATRKMETQPTVVSVVKPVWPERVSQWEMNRRKEFNNAKYEASKVRPLQEQKDRDDNTIRMLEGTKLSHLAQIRKLTEERNAHAEIIAQNPDKTKFEALKQLRDLDRRKNEFEEEKRAFEIAKQKTAAEEERINREKKELEAAQAKWFSNRMQMEKAQSDDAAARMAKLTQMDADVAAAKSDLHDRLMAAWRDEIKKVHELKKYFERKKIVIDSGAEVTVKDGDFTESEVAQILKNAEEAAKRNTEARKNAEVEAQAQAHGADRDAEMGGT